MCNIIILMSILFYHFHLSTANTKSNKNKELFIIFFYFLYLKKIFAIWSKVEGTEKQWRDHDSVSLPRPRRVRCSKRVQQWSST